MHLEGGCLQVYVGSVPTHDFISCLMTVGVFPETPDDGGMGLGENLGFSEKERKGTHLAFKVVEKSFKI